MILGATVPWAHQTVTGVRSCPRCGRERGARKQTVLCTDCRYTLTPAEALAWKEAA